MPFSKDQFVANSANDLLQLQELKTKFKMLSGSVIQDCYNILGTTACVEGVLSLAFPDLYEKEASIIAKPLMPFKPAGKKFNDTNAAWQQIELKKKASGQPFWTS